MIARWNMELSPGIKRLRRGLNTKDELARKHCLEAKKTSRVFSFFQVSLLDAKKLQLKPGYRLSSVSPNVSRKQHVWRIFLRKKKRKMKIQVTWSSFTEDLCIYLSPNRLFLQEQEQFIFHHTYSDRVTVYETWSARRIHLSFCQHK